MKFQFFSSLPRLAALTLSVGLALTSSQVLAQALAVMPVNIQLAPKQMATSLSVMNRGDAESSVQIRAFTWKQINGVEQLTPAEDLQVSPPIATIAPGATQVVRLVLRRAPRSTEATYRVVVDQIPPVAESGTVRIALRLSIPVFVAAAGRSAAHVAYRVESRDGVATLIAVNDGTRHETLRDVSLTRTGSGALTSAANASPYILAGATRSWPIVAGSGSALPVAGDTLQLNARANAGLVKESLTVVGGP